MAAPAKGSPPSTERIRPAAAEDFVDRGRALVIADDIGVFLAVVRSLGRIGVEVDVVTTEGGYPGLSSRFIERVHTAPPYLSSPGEWIEALASLARQYDYRLIIPTSDSSLALLAAHADRLGRHRLAIPNPAAFAAFSDKTETRKLAEQLGVPVAEGFEVDPGADAAELIGKLGLPLVLKPAQSYRVSQAEAKTSARIVTGVDDATAALAAYADRRIIAERFFPGEGVGVSVLARNGEVELFWQHRRIASVGATGRSSIRAGEAVSPLLMDHVRSAARATGLNGVAMFEFRHDTRADSYILVEVNPRFWGSLPLAVASGADFPARLWRATIAEAHPGGENDPSLGLRKADMSAECERLALQSHGPRSRSRWAAFRGAIALCAASVLWPPRFDSWALDDPGPYFKELRSIAKRIAEALRHRWRRVA